MTLYTEQDYNGWKFRKNSMHLNGGAVFFGYGHTCVDQPRLVVIDKYFKKDRSSKRTYVVDGRSACETLDAALAALSEPPKLSAEDFALLREAPDGEYRRVENRVRFLELAHMGMIEWGRDADNHVTLRLTDAGRAARDGASPKSDGASGD